MKNTIINVSLQVLLLVVFFFLIESKKEKTGFVRLEKIYEDFEMKKEFETKFKNVEAKRKSILDSLEFNLTFLFKKINSSTVDKQTMDEYENRKESYFVQKQRFNEENQKLMDQYHNQIITRINDYAISFGKLNGFEYIYGTENGGSLMYANERKDITTDFLKFINSAYKSH